MRPGLLAGRAPRLCVQILGITDFPNIPLFAPGLMSRKKISTTIYVTPEQSERLRLLHERTKVPVAVYIREGIDLVLRQYGHLLPGQLPLADAPASGAAGAAGAPVLVADPKPAPLRQERAERVDGAAATGSERVVGGAGTKS